MIRINQSPNFGTGPILTTDGSASAPSYSFLSDSNTGFSLGAGGSIIMNSNGTSSLVMGYQNFGLITSRPEGGWSWVAGSDLTAALDLQVLRDAANTLAQKNGTNAQTFNHYGSEITAGSRYSRLAIKHATTSVTAAVGATVTATNLIPAKANVLGVNTVVTTGLGTK